MKESKRPRRTLGWVLIVGTAAVLSLLAWDWMAFNGEAVSCPSDGLSAAKFVLHAFNKQNKRYPHSAEEFYAFLEKHSPSHINAKHRLKTQFIVPPSDVIAPNGNPVLLMCPWRSHGFLRKYAFGVGEGGVVRIRSKTNVKWLSRRR